MASSALKRLVALSEVAPKSNLALYEFILLPNEEVLKEYKAFRDTLVITQKRIILIDPQGLTGKKKSYFSLPLSKLSAFEVETAGTLDLDAEFKCWVSGIGLIEFEFTRGTDVKGLAALLSQNLL